MHRESIVEALLGTALVFNTVFEMPESDPLFFQIFGASLVFVMLYKLFENARKLEKRIKKSPPGGNPVADMENYIRPYCKGYKGEKSR
ncbi:MAG: hypothetical protein ACLT5X_09205 [Blautia producta]